MKLEGGFSAPEMAPLQPTLWQAHFPPHLLCATLQQPDLSPPASFTPLFTPLNGERHGRERQHKKQSWRPNASRNSRRVRTSPGASCCRASICRVLPPQFVTTSLEETQSLPSLDIMTALWPWPLGHVRSCATPVSQQLFKQPAGTHSSRANRGQAWLDRKSCRNQHSVARCCLLSLSLLPLYSKKTSLPPHPFAQKWGKPSDCTRGTS